MNKQVIIVGAGGHARVIADTVLCSGDTVLGFLDDDAEAEGVAGIPVLGSTAEYGKYPEASFVLGIGSAAVRERLAAFMDGVSWYTAIHPSAVISSLGTEIGEGTVLMAGTVVNAGAVIGRHCIINTGAIIEHDNRIEDFAHVSVGAKLAGTVHVGKRSWIGVGAIVRNNTSICEDCMIGAGAVVVRDIERAGTYMGIPARLKMLINSNGGGAGKTVLTAPCGERRAVA